MRNASSRCTASRRGAVRYVASRIPSSHVYKVCARIYNMTSGRENLDTASFGIRKGVSSLRSACRAERGRRATPLSAGESSRIISSLCVRMLLTDHAECKNKLSRASATMEPIRRRTRNFFAENTIRRISLVAHHDEGRDRIMLTSIETLRAFSRRAIY